MIRTAFNATKEQLLCTWKKCLYTLRIFWCWVHDGIKHISAFKIQIPINKIKSGTQIHFTKMLPQEMSRSLWRRHWQLVLIHAEISTVWMALPMIKSSSRIHNGPVDSYLTNEVYLILSKMWIATIFTGSVYSSNNLPNKQTKQKKKINSSWITNILSPTLECLSKQEQLKLSFSGSYFSFLGNTCDKNFLNFKLIDQRPLPKYPIYGNQQVKGRLMQSLVFP